jgi:glycosyltransferase involved in cell wall biosynthesis
VSGQSKPEINLAFDVTNPPSLSIIIRTLNRNQLLREALRRLTNQTRQDFEVVIVDMNAAGATEVIDEFREKLPSLVHLHVGKLFKRPTANNFGIQHATSDKITILDDDNLYDPNQVDILVRGLEETGADLVYTGVRRTTYNDAGELIDVKIWHEPFDFGQLLRRNYIHGVGTAFRKSTWARLGGFDERFAVYEDYDCLLRVASTGRIEHMPDVAGESRSFTGIVGLQNHARETVNVERCQAGIYWVHRDLFFPPGARLAGYSAQLRSKGVVKDKSRRADIINAAVFSLRLAKNLLGWWYHNLNNEKRHARS